MMKNKFKTIFLFSLTLVIILISLFGCDLDKARNFKTTTFRIGKSTYIEAVNADVLGDQLSTEEIDILARKIFKQASLINGTFLVSPETMEIDESKSIMAKSEDLSYLKDKWNMPGYTPDDKIYKWKKIVYIETWEEFQTICESVLGKEYCEQNILRAARYRIIEHDGYLYQCQDLVGGVGGNWHLEANRSKIKVLSQKENAIEIRANMKDLICLGYDDKWVDGDLEYTIIRQNGYWVLKDFQGVNPKQ
ncbi:hypothetical protein RBG61_00890 [Paludicola sp. MB14-C6]|uniref:hypothetical protein n=1 Tax=Paludihabitans sp. MB14-C6 TaxID=3070656 RepID=UPI0027DD52A3|nr:hypothetical protein [Paludicola sp. MB14-C6]WMJ23244.1 hypothetical protein RBG61_00890 [Paludicola sp. MB14-C6]